MSNKINNSSNYQTGYTSSGYLQKTSYHCRLLATLLLLMLLIQSADFCGPGRGYGFRRGPRKMTPLVFKQHVPSVSETTLGASGPPEGKISRGDIRMKKLVVNYNKEIVFKDEEGTGADRIMSKRCKEMLDALSVLVMNQWEDVRLRVTEAWDEEGHHSPESLHYEGRAVDITTSDRDRSKYGMLARLAVEVGFDWVYFESKGHVHCSVKSDSSITLRTGGCFSGDDEVLMESGERKRLDEVSLGDRVLAMDSLGHPIYDEIIAFIHRDTKLPTVFSILSLSNGRNITLTSDHLIYINSDSGLPESTFVSRLTPENYIYSSNFTNFESHDTVDYKLFKFHKVRIEKIDSVEMIGVFAPLTRSGTIVVNDVVASCYASIDSHWLAHISMTPLRIASYFHDLIWERSKEEKEGVHWFAEMLRVLGRHLLPSSYWYT